MEILNFIFGLGVAFSIFAFLWGVIMLAINFLRGIVNDRRQKVLAALIGQRLDFKSTASRDKRIRRAEVYAYR